MHKFPFIVNTTMDKVKINFFIKMLNVFTQNMFFEKNCGKKKSDFCIKKSSSILCVFDFFFF
jgi:hypothetical protein